MRGSRTAAEPPGTGPAATGTGGDAAPAATSTGPVAARAKQAGRPPVPIVSSQHLASEEGWQLSEFEYGLITAYNAFQRWMLRCMAAAGHRDFGPLDVLVLHNVNHRSRPKRIADISHLLNIEDQHTVNYALKKLVKAGLVAGERQGKEIFYRTTPAGAELCGKYREIRELCLTSSYKQLDQDTDEMRRMAEMLRLMSGLYDQAARAAASL